MRHIAIVTLLALILGSSCVRSKNKQNDANQDLLEQQIKPNAGNTAGQGREADITEQPLNPSEDMPQDGMDIETGNENTDLSSGFSDVTSD